MMSRNSKKLKKIIKLLFLKLRLTDDFSDVLKLSMRNFKTVSLLCFLKN